MGIYIVQDKNKAKMTWNEIRIGLHGEIFINLGMDSFQTEREALEKVAVRFEPEPDECVYVMKDMDYMISFIKLGKLYVDMWVLESDIGRIVAHKLVSTQLAERYYGG